MAFATALRVTKKSFSNGQDFHVGMKDNLEFEVTSVPGYSHVFQTFVDPKTGYTKTIVKMVKS